MKPRTINAFLLITILVMALGPLFGALYFVDKALVTSLNLGFNEEVTMVLSSSAEHLKDLARLDPERTEAYRAEFERIAKLRAVYESRDTIKTSVRDSLLIYFAIGVVTVLLASILVAALMSRAIATSYRIANEELIKQRDRMRYLEELSSWQELAKMLTHEIKNPLTPIEMLVTALPNAHRQQSSGEFQALLARTETMVLEELSRLKAMVANFSSFAKLPAAQLAEQNLRHVLREQFESVAHSNNQAGISLSLDAIPESLRVRIDSTMLRQALINIVKNGLEANPDRKVHFVVSVVVAENSIELSIANDGVPVPRELAPRMFDPYVSGGAAKDNMGLGLAIVRKIMLEHGGDAVYRDREGHPEFVLTLPRIDA